MRIILTISALLLSTSALAATPQETARWQTHAQRTTITRDDFGIPHIKGKTNADAVFGMIYAQAEDDFNRIEVNYLNALGRMAEAEGSSAIWTDLRQRLWINDTELKAEYAKSPAWLQTLMVAWADGLNLWLDKNPGKARVLTHFEPWMALSFSEGSIGGDIESVNTTRLQNFIESRNIALSAADRGAVATEPAGSNGFAIAPSNTKGGNALLLINPHTSFFFRSESQLQSDEGLDAYGATTWGQFFIYQGFNENLGWMHTSSGSDVIDEFALTIEMKDGQPGYRYGETWKALERRDITLAIKDSAPRTITTWRSPDHGPIVRAEGGKWIAVSLMHKPSAALQQSWLRTTAKNLADYMRIADLRANSSNATLFASRQGDIAYLHPQFMPKRNNSFDYTRPVDGNNPATNWQGEHPVADLPNVINPKSGWAMNTNNWPWSAAGADSPKQSDFPKYIDNQTENPRGVNATRLLSAKADFTSESLLEAAYDPWLSAFATLIPTLIEAYDGLPATDPMRTTLAGPIEALRIWDYKTSEASIPTTLATRWGEALWASFGAAARAERMPMVDFLKVRVGNTDKLTALADITADLTKDWGNWQVPWGEINRYQRISPAIDQKFTDTAPSIPIPFASANWGSLASYGTVRPTGQKRSYGRYGNSFVAIVEFGKTVTARAIMAGGQSGDPGSPHYNDQAERYRTHNFRQIPLTPAALKPRTEKTYHPGE
jgi:acyl-homoserine-lactone acylase